MTQSDSTWVPGLLFVFLGCFFLQKAIRPGAKQSWSWGRGGGEVPVSRWGYASWSVAFLSISAIVAHAPSPPMAWVIVLLASFVAILVAGSVDTYRYNKAHRAPDPDRSQKVQPRSGLPRPGREK